MEAILVAARRYQEKLKDDKESEQKIRDLLADSEVEIKNKIEIFILEKSIPFDALGKMQQEVKEGFGIFYLLEGSTNFTIITQEKFASVVTKKYAHKVIAHNKNLALINFISPPSLEYTPGIIHYLTSLFFEHDINIVEMISFWTDTLFAINTKDVSKAMEFLRF